MLRTCMPGLESPTRRPHNDIYKLVGFPVLAGSHAVIFFENILEIITVGETTLQGDLGHALVR